jgi:hypothetical protein
LSEDDEKSVEKEKSRCGAPQKGFPTKATLTNPNRVTVYVPSEKQEVIKKAKELFKKDNKSLSTFLVETLENYVATHYPGNPQLTFDGKAELYFPPSAQAVLAKKKKDVVKCSFHGCNKPVAGIVVSQKGMEYAVCEDHRRACLESGKWTEKGTAEMVDLRVSRQG